ncbi:MAG: hypothetical protein HYY08_00950 [Firmicutes bacterium]|nr:hypothetical protein [Bacillota bacterium]
MASFERVRQVLNFGRPDRLPVIEWACWWDKTIERWRGEGLPPNVTSMQEIHDFFGLDVHYQFWLPAKMPGFPGGEGIAGMRDYDEVRKYLYPSKLFEPRDVEKAVAARDRGEAFIWLTLEGFFWFPRTVLGIEKHFYSFYDIPEVVHAMNRDLLEHHQRSVDEFCTVCIPDFVTFAEDMSYNHGPMLSKNLFDEFMAPYYLKIVPKLREYGIIPIIDSDGLIDDLVPWFEEVGVDGFLPLEKQAGVDIVRLRERHPRLRVIGGFDKMVMSKGEAEMRAEFERLLPVIEQGGYIPSVDHQTPPGVSLENYRIYIRLLKEYAGV